MAHSYLRFGIFWLLISCCIGFSAQAQRPPRVIIYDSLGRPIRVNHELIVGFDPSVINRAAVNSRSGNEGTLDTFLKPGLGAALQAELGFPLNAIYAIKFVKSTITGDSLATDGTSLPPLWNMLVLCLPPETDDYVTITALGRRPFSEIQFANFYWATPVVPANGTNGTTSKSAFLLDKGSSTPLAYPMPAHDVITIALPSPLPASAELTVFSQTGQVVHTEKHKVFQHSELLPFQINLAALPTGQYFYRLVTPKNTYKGRFEKQ